MARIDCPKCGSEMPAAAGNCPSCGVAVARPGELPPGVPAILSPRGFRIQAIIAGVIFAVGFVWMFFEVNAAVRGGSASHLPIALVFLGASWYVGIKAAEWSHLRALRHK